MNGMAFVMNFQNRPQGNIPVHGESVGQCTPFGQLFVAIGKWFGSHLACCKHFPPRYALDDERSLSKRNRNIYDPTLGDWTLALSRPWWWTKTSAWWDPAHWPNGHHLKYHPPPTFSFRFVSIRRFSLLIFLLLAYCSKTNQQFLCFSVSSLSSLSTLSLYNHIE